MKTKLLILIGAALMLAAPAFAHHSFAMFDYSKEITITGEVKELRWRNPHIHILVNVSDGKGGMAEWDVEGGTPDTLHRTGWSKEILKPGDKGSIVIRPLKNGGKGGNLIKANRGDGTPIGTGNAGGGN